MKNSVIPITLSAVSLCIAGFTFIENNSLKNKIATIEQPKLSIEYPEVKIQQAEPIIIKNDSQEDQQLVVIDFQDIYNAYRLQSGADNQLNAVVKQANIALNKKREELRVILEDIKKNQEKINQKDIKKEALAAIKKELTEQLVQAQNLSDLINQQSAVIQENVNAEATRINENLYTDIQRIIKRKAQAKGVRYVINSQARDTTNTPIFLYSMETVDLTSEIMKEIGLKPVQSSNPKVSPTIKIPQEALATKEVPKTVSEESIKTDVSDPTKEAQAETKSE